MSNAKRLVSEREALGVLTPRGLNLTGAVLRGGRGWRARTGARVQKRGEFVAAPPQPTVCVS